MTLGLFRGEEAQEVSCLVVRLEEIAFERVVRYSRVPCDILLLATHDVVDVHFGKSSFCFAYTPVANNFAY